MIINNKVDSDYSLRRTLYKDVANKVLVLYVGRKVATLRSIHRRSKTRRRRGSELELSLSSTQTP